MLNLQINVCSYQLITIKVVPSLSVLDYSDSLSLASEQNSETHHP
jgi:hypothetical protein